MMVNILARILGFDEPNTKKEGRKTPIERKVPKRRTARESRMMRDLKGPRRIPRTDSKKKENDENGL